MRSANSFTSILIVLLCFPMATYPQGLGEKIGFIASDYTVKQFTPQDGLGSVQVRGIVQDSLGFIWVGSRDVISRFDGYSFKLYQFNPQALSLSEYTGGLLSLHTDRTQNLWVRSEFFSKFDHAADSFIHYKPDLNLAEISRVCFDRTKSVVWFGTGSDGLFLFDLSSGETHHFEITESVKNKQAANSIRGLGDFGRFLLVATLDGVWMFDKKSKKFNRPTFDNQVHRKLLDEPDWNILDFTRENPHDAWLFGSGIMVRIDRNLNVTKLYHLPTDLRSFMHTRDNKGVIWHGTPHGLFKYDPRDDSSTLVKTEVEVGALTNYIFADEERNIWLGSENNGLYQLTEREVMFKTYQLGKPANWSTGSLHRVNGNDHLIIARPGGRGNEIVTVAFPLLNDSVAILKAEVKNPPPGFIINSTIGKNAVWFSSWMQGITGFRINRQSGLIETDSVVTMPADPIKPNAIRPFVSAAFESSDGKLWTASRGHGVGMIDLAKPYGETGSVVYHLRNIADTASLSHNYCWEFYPEDERSFLVINWSSVDRFEGGKFKPLFTNVKRPRSLLRISDDTLVIGTYQGLYEAVRSGNGYSLIDSGMLKNYLIYEMTADAAGRLWFTDPKKNVLVCYDRREKIAIEFNEEDGLPQGRTYMAKLSNGSIATGAVSGFMVFDPSTLSINREKALPVFTAIEVNNQTPPISSRKIDHNTDFHIENDISRLRELALDYKHNNFSVQFSAMEFAAPKKNLYRYKLEGFDANWIVSDWKDRAASYTNLDPGNYRLRVRASNHHGIWSDAERVLVVRVLPPPWQRWWAYTAYFIIVCGMIVAWRQYDVRRVRLKHRAQHLAELDSLKSNFFANISHEFRTPITLILGPLAKFYNKASSKEEKHEMGIMLRNGERLHHLINQLLDLSKIEAGRMQLRASSIDAVQFVRQVASSYESAAADRKIRLLTHEEPKELLLYADQDKLEKVIHNLLSNALKFTEPGGDVIVDLRSDKSNCFITVKDTGIGIPSDQLDKIFDRFYQVDSSQTRGYEGTGLGMALAKELVELHKGKISVQSIEGKGTRFIIALPLGKAHLAKDEIDDSVHHIERQTLSDILVTADHEENVNEPTASATTPLILIVEDNADMRSFIRKTLAPNYQIIEAENGNAGLMSAKQNIPDLIISDIMMPEIDGLKMCSLLKSNELTSHVPVILLTAKADRESKLSGLGTGADDYLAKPFDADELILIVRNRIEERRKMRERFSREITLGPKQILITSMDEKFIMKVLGIVDEHMDDEQFTIDELSREAGFSNMHFYRKIKALSGQTPSQFLRTIRLKRAAEMLSKNSDNVTQIAFNVGFSSLAYFDKCFREQFGMTPGQYAESNSKVKA